MLASAVVAVSSPSASAGDAERATYGDVASVWFDHDGDHFYLCDHAEDGYSVAVEFLWDRVSSGQFESDRRWNWWGPYKYNGCKDINIDAVEDSIVNYRVCIGDNAAPGGAPAVVVECGDWTWDVA